jgi:hypothetical protein
MSRADNLRRPAGLTPPAICRLNSPKSSPLICFAALGEHAHLCERVASSDGQGVARIDHLIEPGSKKISAAHSKSPRKQYLE